MSYPEDIRTVYFLSISLDGVSAPGTYVCNGISSRMTFTQLQLGSGARKSFQSTEYNGGKGTIIISEIDTKNKTIKGTFSGTLVSASGDKYETKVITNGVINTIY